MSVVIIGGNECMERAYFEKCACYGYRAKVYTKRPKDLARVFGCPDLCILFTSTVSHNLVQVANNLAKRKRVPVARSHVSSLNALETLLKERQK